MTAAPRLFIASLMTETNSFAPFPTGRAAFEENVVTKSASREPGVIAGGGMALLRQRGEALGYDVVESLSAFAQPGGPTVQSVYEDYRDTILADLAAAGPVDIVLLMLHGAMIADGYDDCEGDMLQRVRALCPAAVIGVEIDPHCHLTDAMLSNATIFVIYKEYPHVDVIDCADQLFDLCHRTRMGEIRPVAALVDVAMVSLYPTFHPPMSEIVAMQRRIEGEPGVLVANIGHGFPYGDVAETGTRTLVYTDGDAALAGHHALALARRLYAERHALVPRYPDIGTALDRAGAHNGCIVLGDYADNAGGGAPSDSTFFLREMVERGTEHAVIGCFHDPAVAQICADAGVGARLAVRLGGKSGPASGDPIDLIVEVMGVVANHSQSVFGSRMGMGLAVWLRHAGIDILVNTIRSQPYGTDLFTGIGITLDDKRLIICKSSSHYESGFSGVADQLWHVASPGALSTDFATIGFTRRDPVFFPRVDDPWASKGEPVPKFYPGGGAAT